MDAVRSCSSTGFRSIVDQALPEIGFRNRFGLNVLVMGPGGYRFVDYVKVGVPLTLIMLTVLMLILPVFWPLTQ